MLRTETIYILLASANVLLLFAQNPEPGIAIWNRSERALRINSYRPLDSAASILASDYQINISSEDPPFACSDDILETHSGHKNLLTAEHIYMPKGSAFEVSFSVTSARYPSNSRDLLNRLVAAYNRNGHFQYRVYQKGDFFSFVPIFGRDKTCHVIRIEPLLDQQISLPSEHMSIYSAVAAIEVALHQKAQEPVHVNTQEWLNGIPDLKVSFPSRSGSARDMLLTLIKATHYRFYWLTREQPIQAGWTINLIPLTSRIEKASGGAFNSPWILLPGQRPLPPMPAPQASDY